MHFCFAKSVIVALSTAQHYQIINFKLISLYSIVLLISHVFYYFHLYFFVFLSFYIQNFNLINSELENIVQFTKNAEEAVFGLLEQLMKSPFSGVVHKHIYGKC